MTLIGFRRNLYLEWLEEVATLAALGGEPAAIRAQLDERLAPTIRSDVNRQQAVVILTNIWLKSAEASPRLHGAALELFQQTAEHDDHVALHYGLTLVMYPFFRQAVVVVGETLRFGATVRTATLQERMPGVVGGFGALPDACRRVTFSLRNWGVLVETSERYSYAVREPRLRLSTPAHGCWLLAAALQAHPAEALPFQDLLRLPELFGFNLAVTPRELRECEWVEVHRAGGGYDMVVLRD